MFLIGIAEDVSGSGCPCKLDVCGGGGWAGLVVIFSLELWQQPTLLRVIHESLSLPNGDKNEGCIG